MTHRPLHSLAAFAAALLALPLLAALLHGRLALVDVGLTRPRVALEQGSGGRKSWLMDRTQTDETRRLPIGRVLLDRGEIAWLDSARGTDLRVTLSTVPSAGPGTGTDPLQVVFGAQGRYEGQPMTAEGHGGAVMAWLDDTMPYPLTVRATLGRTHLDAEGTVTRLLHPSAVDLQLAVRGDDLAALFPLVRIALPPTPAYRSAGRLLRSGTQWRYEAFTGQVGRSDVAGHLQVDGGGARPRLSGAITSRRLDLADLGPAVGARSAPVAAAQATPGPVRLLPELPIETARWGSLDADVTLKAQSLLRDKALPLENLELRLSLTDRQLTLDPLAFGLAGGRLQARVTLDGRTTPLRGAAKAQLRGLVLGRLLPTVDLSKASIGRLDGDIELAGQGASVGRMLAHADGRVSLVAQNGQISRLLMEQIGLHLLEILQLQLTGDNTVALNCAVADFGVAGGTMTARALVLDTAVNTLVGSGRIDLAQETLDLRFVPHTKVSSIVALRSPFYVTGPFAQPALRFDTARIAARGVGAIALGLLNPLLALIPLFEAGPGVDSECGRLVRAARGALPAAKP
jgi:uncharacterized protein involved in outer membrane biogenesis